MYSLRLKILLSIPIFIGILIFVSSIVRIFNDGNGKIMIIEF